MTTSGGLVRVTCPGQPSLWIPSLPVQFVDGQAEVPASMLDDLATYRVHGVILPGDVEDAPPGPAVMVEAPAAPAKRAARKASPSPFGN